MFSRTTKTHTVRWKSFKTVFNLTDHWRYTYLNERKYTWFSGKTPKQMARLDFYLVSSDLIPMVTKSGMYTGYRTDHSLVYLYINIRIPQRGKGLWNFNPLFCMIKLVLT